jgi:hypothetical protein
MLAASTIIDNTPTTGATTEQPVPSFTLAAPSKPPTPAAAEAAGATAAGGGLGQASIAAQPAAALAADPRLAKCGFAKLLGDNGLEYYIRKYEVILGRRSKVGSVGHVATAGAAAAVDSGRECHVVTWHLQASVRW